MGGSGICGSRVSPTLGFNLPCDHQFLDLGSRPEPAKLRLYQSQGVHYPRHATHVHARYISTPEGLERIGCEISLFTVAHSANPRPVATQPGSAPESGARSVSGFIDVSVKCLGSVATIYT